MTDAALYHTTAATLTCAKIHAWATTLLGAVALIVLSINNHTVPALTLLLCVMGWSVSIYYHIRIHLDVKLLQNLAQGALTDTDLDQALLQLQLRRQTKTHTPQSRCLACLAFWRKSMLLDCVLCCVSSLTVIFTLST